MNLLVPCAGRSSRFRTRTPKYLLAMPDQRLMFDVAIDPFLKQADRVIFGILREHDENFRASEIIKQFVPDATVVVLDEVTRGQAETVLQMLERADVEGAFLVKDSDSYFNPVEAYDPSRNYISLCSARQVRDVKLYNKSFAKINEQNYVVGMVEKEISSEFFSCGGYFFSEVDDFVTTFHDYERMQVAGEFYLSAIIDLMIRNGHIFHPMICQNYADWGTHEDWVAYRKRTATYIFDLDGVIFKNGTRFWQPRWGENSVIGEARDRVNSLYGAGNYIVLMTSRPDEFREVTERQLRNENISYHQLVMGVYHGTRIVVNDFGPTNPYPASVAINTKRDSGDFVDKL